jgi:hypothetical protein
MKVDPALTKDWSLFKLKECFAAEVTLEVVKCIEWQWQRKLQ